MSTPHPGWAEAMRLAHALGAHATSHTITAEDPLPHDLHAAIDAIHTRVAAH